MRGGVYHYEGSTSACTGSSSSSGRVRRSQRASGLRRHAPTPEHGASTSTRSYLEGAHHYEGGGVERGANGDLGGRWKKGHGPSVGSKVPGLFS